MEDSRKSTPKRKELHSTYVESTITTFVLVIAAEVSIGIVAVSSWRK